MQRRGRNITIIRVTISHRQIAETTGRRPAAAVVSNNIVRAGPFIIAGLGRAARKDIHSRIIGRGRKKRIIAKRRVPNLGTSPAPCIIIAKRRVPRPLHHQTALIVGIVESAGAGVENDHVIIGGTGLRRRYHRHDQFSKLENYI